MNVESNDESGRREGYSDQQFRYPGASEYVLTKTEHPMTLHCSRDVPRITSVSMNQDSGLDGDGEQISSEWS